MPVIRLFGAAVAAAALSLGAAAAAEQKRIPPVRNEGGMYTQPWFLESFLDLGEDLAEAASKGKRFAIIWEQRGCPYCRETHVVNFGLPEIRNFIKSNFTILQLDIHGAREVTDFDGKALSESALATKYGVRYTPTITFYKETPKPGAEWKSIELTRLTGYYRPFHFLAAFQYIREKGYERQNFKDFVVARQAQRLKQGKPVTFR